MNSPFLYFMLNTRELLRRKLINKTKKKVEEKYSGEEEHLIRAVNALQDLDEIFNLLSEHCREWYASHFPELERIVTNPEILMKLVYFLGDRKEFSEKKAAEYSKEKASLIAKKAKESMGSKIPEAALAEIKLIALNALNMREERKALEKFVNAQMKAVAPNTSKIAGPILGAKLLKEAGSLKKLALMPSSTVQILGAKKAFFRHVKNPSAKTPKYGILFQHPMVKQVPMKNKGKIARTLAGKISIAVRADFFGKKDVSKELQKDLDARTKQLKTK